MEALGEELYGIIQQCYPELAPKLTGMLLSMGEEECRACLDSQEHLAERLDEAFRILDANGQCAKERAPEEKRIDPEDGKARTFNELRALCASRYTLQEIEEYWRTCQPVDGAGAPAAKAKAKAAPAPAAAKPSGAAPRAAPAAAAAPGTATVAAAPGAEEVSDDALPGLTAWLRELKLTGYAEAAAEWIEEQGACSLEEVVENLEDFAETLGLKKLERKRLEQQGEAAAKAAMEAAASAAAASAAAAPQQQEEAAREARPAKTKTSLEEAQDAKLQREVEEARQEREELERELEELKAMEAEMDGEAAKPDRPRRGAPGPKSSAAPAKAKAPSMRVAPKAPALSREEIEWNRENEKQELEFKKKQQAKQAARDAEAAAQEAEEKRQARAREAQERQERAAAELAAKVSAASPGAGEAAAAEAEDFPALGGGDWQATTGKKGRKKR